MSKVRYLSAGECVKEATKSRAKQPTWNLYNEDFLYEAQKIDGKFAFLLISRWGRKTPSLADCVDLSATNHKQYCALVKKIKHIHPLAKFAIVMDLQKANLARNAWIEKRRLQDERAYARKKAADAARGFSAEDLESLFNETLQGKARAHADVIINDLKQIILDFSPSGDSWNEKRCGLTIVPVCDQKVGEWLFYIRVAHHPYLTKFDKTGELNASEISKYASWCDLFIERFKELKCKKN